MFRDSPAAPLRGGEGQAQPQSGRHRVGWRRNFVTFSEQKHKDHLASAEREYFFNGSSSVARTTGNIRTGVGVVMRTEEDVDLWVEQDDYIHTTKEMGAAGWKILKADLAGQRVLVRVRRPKSQPPIDIKARVAEVETSSILERLAKLFR